jgi:hypothetical protein
MVRPVTTVAVALAGLLVWACSGHGPVGIDACKSIETARCQQAAKNCPSISLSPPISTSGSAEDACIRYYDTACLHGLPVADPGTTAVSQCIAAINSGDCDVVATPEIDPACSWLIPPIPEAGPDVEEAASEASPDGETE